MSALPTQSIGGLVSGFDTANIIEQLMQIERRPVKKLEVKKMELEAKQEAYRSVSRLLLNFKSQVDTLGKLSTYSQKTALSSNEGLLAATAYNSAAVGTYAFRVAQTAQTHQALSNGYASEDAAVGAGEIRIDEAGSTLRNETKIAELNGNRGIFRGSIRITDRAGKSAVVDLSLAETAQDVIDTINDTAGIDVTAAVDDSELGLQLTDSSGGAGNFIVEEVSGGQTAADLGLLTAAGGVASSTIDGEDIYYLAGTTSLANLRDGLGVDDGEAGTIRLSVDENGDGTVYTPYDVDLTAASSVQDVLNAINGAGGGGVFEATLTSTGINITNLAGKDFIVHNDATDNNDTTAIDLGIYGRSTGGAVAGDDLIGGLNTVMLSSLSGKNPHQYGFGKIFVSDRVGTTMTANMAGATTLQEAVDVINARATAKGANIVASVNADGDAINILDTSGAPTENLTIQDVSGTDGASYLGINIDGAYGTVEGLPPPARGTYPGRFTVTDRAGNTADLNLFGARTLEDVIDAINTSGTNVTAQLNAAGNGLTLTDSTASGSIVGNLVIADNPASTLAEDLGIAVDAAVSQVKTGDLDRHYISRATSLEDLNQGQGIYKGRIRLTDANGDTATGDFSELETVGDVVDALNASGLAIHARINDTGDGILVVNTEGTGTITIEDEDGGTTAEDLNLLGSAGSGSSIDGTFERVVSVDGNDTLKDLVYEIGMSGAPVQASILNDGSGVNPYHLTIASQQSGRDGMLVIDTDIAGLDFSDMSKAQNSLLLYGATQSGVSPVLLSSEDNRFDDAVPGLSLTANAANPGETVTVNVNRDTESVVSTAEAMVKGYNELHVLVGELTKYDQENQTPGLLFGDSTLHSMMSDISDLVLTSVPGLDGGISQMYDIGIQFKYEYDENNENQKAYLDLDTQTLQQALATNFESVKELMTKSVDVARRGQNAFATASSAGGSGTDVKNVINGDTSSGDFGADNGYEGSTVLDGTNEESITVSFGEAREVYQLALHHIDSASMPADEYALRDFTVEYFDTLKESWETARSYTGNTSGINYISLPDGTRTDQVRITATDTNAPDNLFRFVELEAFESQGVASQLRTSLRNITDSRSGTFALAQDSLDTRIDDIDATIEGMEERLEMREISLLREFTAMEEALAEMQQQGDFFAQQMASLNGGGDK
jgi:flagellar hook-associated protein 2